MPDAIIAGCNRQPPITITPQPPVNSQEEIEIIGCAPRSNRPAGLTEARARSEVSKRCQKLRLSNARLSNVTTQSMTSLLVCLAAGVLSLSTTGCSSSSPHEVRNQPRPRADHPAATAQPSVRTKADTEAKTGAKTGAKIRTKTGPANTPLKPGTPEYKKKLDDLTDLRLRNDLRPGTRKIRTRCGSRKGRPDCRDCAKEIRRLDAKMKMKIRKSPARLMDSMTAP